MSRPATPYLSAICAMEVGEVEVKRQPHTVEMQSTLRRRMGGDSCK